MAAAPLLDAGRHVAEHRLVQPELPLELPDDRRLGLDLQEDVRPLALLPDLEGQASLAPVLGAHDLAPERRAALLEASGGLRDLLLGQAGVGDDQHVVQSQGTHLLSATSGPSGAPRPPPK